MAVQEIDEELLNGLKQAKGRRMYFAMVLKGSADGALLVAKQKIPPGDIADAKKKCGGTAVIKGACFGEDGKLIFEVAKEPPATLENALKIVAKRDSGLVIHPVCRTGSNPDLLEEGDAVAVPPPPPPAPKAASAAAGASAAAAHAAAAPPKGALPDAEKYTAALHTWEQAAAAAMAAIDHLVSSLEATGDELALAISGVIQQAQADFPDTLDDALTALAKAAKDGNAGDTEAYRNKSEIAIRAALAYLNNNAKTIEGCEQNPFGVAVQIRAPLSEALKQVLIAVKK